MTKNLIKYILVFVGVAVIVAIIIIIYSFTNKSKDIVSTQDKIKQEIEYLDDKLISVANSLNNLDTEYLLTTNEIKANSPNGSSESNSSSGSNSRSENSGNTGMNGSGESSNGNSGGQDNDEQNTPTRINVTTINPKSILTRDRDDVDWQYINTALEEINNSWTIITIDLKSIDIPSDDLLEFSNNMDNALKYTNTNDKTNSLISLANLYSMVPIYENSYSSDTKNIELKYVKSDIISSYALLDTRKMV